jgi:phospholipid transport system substrate-binding protein
MPLPYRGFYRSAAIALLLTSAALGQPARAADEASAFIVQLGAQATSTMTSRTLSSTERVRHFSVIVDRDFDIPRIAQFMLGRYWQTASATERDDFTTVFRNYMIRIYSDNFSQYDSQSFRVIDQHAESATATVVRTTITRTATGEPMTIDWRVIESPDGFKVRDLSVGGVSLAVAQQEEFASIIERDGGQVSILVTQMRSKVTQMETAAQ